MIIFISIRTLRSLNIFIYVVTLFFSHFFVPYCKFVSCWSSKKGLASPLVTDAKEANKWSKLFMASILATFAAIKLTVSSAIDSFNPLTNYPGIMAVRNVWHVTIANQVITIN